MNASGLIDYDMKRAFEWLLHRPREHTGGSDSGNTTAKSQASMKPTAYKSRRLAAVILLKEVAYSVPMVMQAHLSRFFNHIWVSHGAINVLLKFVVSAVGCYTRG